MVFDCTMLINKRILKNPIKVGLPDGNVKLVNCVGDAVINTKILLKDVLLVEGFKHNLLSIGKILEKAKIKVSFTKNNCYFQDPIDNSILATGKQVDGLYILQADDIQREVISESNNQNQTICKVAAVDRDKIGGLAGQKQNENVCNVSALDRNSQLDETHSDFGNNKDCCVVNNVKDLGIIHARLGHVSGSTMKHISEFNCSDLEFVDCMVCKSAKQHKLPFQLSNNRATSIFDLVHFDLWGPYKIQALNGAKYVLTILDDYSRTTWTYLLNNKIQVAKTIIGFFALIETQFEKKIKMIRSDNGTEFIKEQCLDFFLNKGVIHQRSVPKVPQQNGRIERKHRHLLEVARALRFHANLPKKFWGECILTATHIINKLPTKVLHWKCPFELLFKVKPKYEELKVFGCLCYAYNMNNQRDKFDSRSIRCIMIGISLCTKSL
ncbi:Retrovirus-related Pol polyprotein from transposon TNT 1-94 [Bienertia sinuspersici]